MLRISEIDALRRRSGFARVDVVELVAELVDLYEPLARERAIRLVLRNVAVHAIEGDRALLFEAFSNLLDNAIKSSPDARTVQIAMAPGPGGVTLSMSDEGPGTAPALRSAVLQRFYRAPFARDHAGAGLGLSIVAAIVGLHDFALIIGSAEPGACVSIELWPRTLS
jgi:signal transduction histidine kinase